MRLPGLEIERSVTVLLVSQRITLINRLMDSLLSMPNSIRTPNRNKSTDNLEVSVKGIWYGVILVTLIAAGGAVGGIVGNSDTAAKARASGW
jgi:hypothetical protein